jgi:hypothetical protein
MSAELLWLILGLGGVSFVLAIASLWLTMRSLRRTDKDRWKQKAPPNQRLSGKVTASK